MPYNFHTDRYSIYSLGLFLSPLCRIGGTLGAVVTCPLEVVKTRQQSSLKSFDYYHQPSASKKPQRNVVVQIFRSLRHIAKNEGKRGLFRGLGANLIGVAPSRLVCFFVRFLRIRIAKNSIPSHRAIYFCTYSKVKTICNETETFANPETPLIHMIAAASAGSLRNLLLSSRGFKPKINSNSNSNSNTGFFSATLTNPIWMTKTRLQLETCVFFLRSFHSVVRN